MKNLDYIIEYLYEVVRALIKPFFLHKDKCPGKNEVSPPCTGGQCCGSGTFLSPGSGSLKSKTSTKIIRKSYLIFLREDFFC